MGSNTEKKHAWTNNVKTKQKYFNWIGFLFKKKYLIEMFNLFGIQSQNMNKVLM